MFNVFDLIVSGLIWLLDALLLPVLFRVAQFFAGPFPIDSALLDYVRAAVSIVYPIVSTLQMFGLILAIGFSMSMMLARKAVAVWFFLLDLIPGLR